MFIDQKYKTDIGWKMILLILVLVLAKPFSVNFAVAREKMSYSIKGKNKVIGFLVTNNKTIQINGGLTGPVYTVHTNDGKVLAIDLTKKELIAQYPDLTRTLTNGIASYDASLYLPQSQFDAPKY